MILHRGIPSKPSILIKNFGKIEKRKKKKLPSKQKFTGSNMDPSNNLNEEIKVFESRSGRTLVTRLVQDMDLYNSLVEIVKKENVKSGYIVTCVGSLKRAVIRLANADKKLEIDGPFEIVSLVGTISPDGIHVHISISDKDGKCYGGHLQPGCPIFSTGELILGDCSDLLFKRVYDPSTKYKELTIEKA